MSRWTSSIPFFCSLEPVRAIATDGRFALTGARGWASASSSSSDDSVKSRTSPVAPERGVPVPALAPFGVVDDDPTVPLLGYPFNLGRFTSGVSPSDSSESSISSVSLCRIAVLLGPEALDGPGSGEFRFELGLDAVGSGRGLAVPNLLLSDRHVPSGSTVTVSTALEQILRMSSK